MASFRNFHRSFTGGELSPEMFGRFEDPKFQTGAARLRNFISKPQGPVRTRPGFKFVREVRDSSTKVRVIPFVYSSTQALAVEVGAGYFRFHTNGATVLAGSPAAFVTSKALAVVDAGALAGDYFDTTVAHGLLTGDPIRFTTTGTLPTTIPQIVAGTTYYAKAVVGQPSRFQVTLTVGGAAINMTVSFVTDTVVHRVYELGDMVSSGAGTDPGVYYYKISTPTGGHTPTETAFWYRMQPELRKSQVFLPAAVNIAGDIITLGRAHGLSNGDPVEFWNQDGELPGGITEGTTFYARDVTALTFKVAATIGGAAVGLTNLGSTNTGVHRVRYSGTGQFIYEIPNPYIEDNLPFLDYAQSADVLTIVHRDHGTFELRRYGATEWTFLSRQYGSLVSAPGSATATATTRGQALKITSIPSGSPLIIEFTSAHTLAIEDPVYIYDVLGAIGGTLDGFYLVEAVASTVRVQLKLFDTGVTHTLAAPASYTASSGSLQYVSLSTTTSNTYQVTAVDINGVESDAATSNAIVNNLLAAGSFNTVTWPAVTGSVRYRVYKLQRGLYGFIGETAALTFKDDNIGPDMSSTPPVHDNTLNTNAPGAVGYYQQRKVLASTTLLPQGVWMTRPGTEADLSSHIPLQDDDRIAFVIPGAIEIRHILALQQLVLLTSESEIQVTPVSTDALTPTSIDARSHTYIGSSHVRPLIVNNTGVFCAARGGHVKELGFQLGSNGFVSGDLSTRAAHLFDEFEIADSAQSKAPWPILWFISTSGYLLGNTYLPEEQIGAWHWHDTPGTFETCCSIPEGEEDRLYVSVAREVEAFTVRYIEQMAPMAIDADDSATWFFVDSGLTYNSTPATTISGFDHLEGKTINVLADGLVVTPKVVTNGAITLTKAASIVHGGLPITSELQTMPFVAQIDGLGSGRMENVAKVWVRVLESGKFKVGPTDSMLRPAFTDTGLVSRVAPISIDGKWQDDGQVFIRQTDPLPLTIVSLTLQVTIS